MTPVFEWGQTCSQELRYADRCASRYIARGWTAGRAYWTGEEWRVPMIRPPL